MALIQPPPPRLNAAATRDSRALVRPRAPRPWAEAAWLRPRSRLCWQRCPPGGAAMGGSMGGGGMSSKRSMDVATSCISRI
jgi:hypothetical protein